MTDGEAHRAAERAARDSYGRLVALLAARTGDIATAEDAVSEAFVAALRTWPVRGIPEAPTAWLLTAARRTASNVWRHARVQEAAAADIRRQHEGGGPASPACPDDRLSLLFACAHPAIDPAARTPLMLQAVLGLDAARIARAFVVPVSTMSQRLVRAKARIRDAGIRFELPDPEEWPARIADVHDAVYAAFGAGWDVVAGADDSRLELVDDAMYLARLLATLVPDDAEAKGLLALMLYCHSRRAARLDAGGAFIPLRDQDTRLWSRDAIIEAEGLLTSASRHKKFGRFQCEAAIQSVHAQRAVVGRTDHDALDTLYRLLWAHVPAAGVRVAHAAARLEAGHPSEALALIESLPMRSMAGYQPYWVTRAHSLAAERRFAEACEAGERALPLTLHPGVAAFLRQAVARWREAQPGQ